MPSHTSEMKSFTAAKGSKTVAGLSEMNAAGYTIGGKIVEDDVYCFYSGTKGEMRLLVKEIRLQKCTPRYLANMEAYSLKIERYMGGVDDGKVKSESFIRVYDIFKVSLARLVRLSNRN